MIARRSEARIDVAGLPPDKVTPYGEIAPGLVVDRYLPMTVDVADVGFRVLITEGDAPRTTADLLALAFSRVADIPGIDQATGIRIEATRR